MQYIKDCNRETGKLLTRRRLIGLGAAGVGNILLAGCGSQDSDNSTVLTLGTGTPASTQPPTAVPTTESLATAVSIPGPSAGPVTPTPDLTPAEPASTQAAIAQSAFQGRLRAQPGPATNHSTANPFLGMQSLGLDNRRDAWLYLPPGYQPDRPAPLLVMLHGAGGNADQSLSLVQSQADAKGIIVLAPPSRRASWDIIVEDTYGPDIEFINLALAKTFETCQVDPAHIAVGGFSDGASYALCVGLINGDVFTHVIAFSPGFMKPTTWHGKPLFYISHGTQDKVLPVDLCSRKIVPQLKRAGYEVLYHEFEGSHTVPTEISSEAINWFTVGKP